MTSVQGNDLLKEMTLETSAHKRALQVMWGLLLR